MPGECVEIWTISENNSPRCLIEKALADVRENPVRELEAIGVNRFHVIRLMRNCSEDHPIRRDVRENDQSHVEWPRAVDDEVLVTQERDVLVHRTQLIVWWEEP